MKKIKRISFSSKNPFHAFQTHALKFVYNFNNFFQNKRLNLWNIKGEYITSRDCMFPIESTFGLPCNQASLLQPNTERIFLIT